MSDPNESLSRFLSYVLRHAPHAIGLSLDAQGWARIDDLIAKSKLHGRELSHNLLLEVVATCQKKRYSVSADGLFIRANQGHSLKSIELGLKQKTPPSVLYHGTATRFVESILVHGLSRQTRQHIHLSDDFETAVSVGKRHGEPVVFIVQAGALHSLGHLFFRSENDVWLTESDIPSESISLAGNPVS